MLRGRQSQTQHAGTFCMPCVSACACMRVRVSIGKSEGSARFSQARKRIFRSVHGRRQHLKPQQMCLPFNTQNPWDQCRLHGQSPLGNIGHTPWAQHRLLWHSPLCFIGHTVCSILHGHTPPYHCSPTLHGHAHTANRLMAEHGTSSPSALAHAHTRAHTTAGLGAGCRLLRSILLVHAHTCKHTTTFGCRLQAPAQHLACACTHMLTHPPQQLRAQAVGCYAAFLVCTLTCKYTHSNTPQQVCTQAVGCCAASYGAGQSRGTPAA